MKTRRSIHRLDDVAQDAPTELRVGTHHAFHFDVKRRVGKLSDTRKGLRKMQQHLRHMRDRLEDALAEASANRKRAERVLVRCRQS